MITPMLAAKAYAAAAQGLGGDPSPVKDAGQAAGTSFGDILQNVMKDTVQQSRHAEQQMLAGAQGKANLVDVVTAISSAETSLQTVIAVRDQVISAYQEIMRMQI